VIHLEDGTCKLVPEDELPVLIPDLEDFAPSGELETPLARATEWIETTDPETGAPARRDPNTMPQWAGSCWYFIRFCDPTNDEAFCSPQAENYWMPVDLYVGGAEHAVLHLLYSRFWHKVLYDVGVVHTREPFQKLLNPGMILGYSYRYYDDDLSDDPSADPRVYPASAVRVVDEKPVVIESGQEVKARWVHQKDVRWDEDKRPLHPTLDGIVLEEVVEKMSKSKGNVISPDEVIEKHGADGMRLYELFMGPLEKGAPWAIEGISGQSDFLKRVYRLVVDEESEGEPVRELAEGDGTEAQARLTATTIDGVTRDLERMRLNTAISKLMVWSRSITDDGPLPRRGAEAFLLMLSPFAPHLAEELWSRLGHERSLAHDPWPQADPELLVTERISLAVQVGRKVRDTIEVPADADEEEIKAAALASEKVQKHVGGREPSRVIIQKREDGKGGVVNLVL
jgi:leucyl-tRNA synthetase